MTSPRQTNELRVFRVFWDEKTHHHAVVTAGSKAEALRIAKAWPETLSGLADHRYSMPSRTAYDAREVPR